MATIDPVQVKLVADVADLKAGLERAEGYLKNLETNVNKASTGMASFGSTVKKLGATLGVTFGATQVFQFFRESIAASQEAQAAQTRLRELLLNTNGATEEQIVALNNQAKALEQVGVVSADNITVAQSQLATFDLTAKTINTLTPAILDYVVAEKGAAASADDFKQMTNGLAQALQGNFASLTRTGFVLDEQTKKLISTGTESERAAAIVKVLGTTYEGFNEKLRKTSAGAMQVAINDFNNLKQEIGDGLQPIVDGFANFLTSVLFPALRRLIGFIKNNIDEIKVFAIVLGVGATALGVYTVAQKLATLSFKNFNEVLKKNAFALIVTAIALVAAGLVKLWNNSETFRKVVISVAKAALNAFASIIPMIAQVYEAILKIVTGPMRLFLTGLSKLPGVGKYAKSGLDIINKGLDGISDFGDKAAKKAKELSDKLDGMAKIAKKAGEETGKAVTDPFKGDTGGGKKTGGISDKQLKQYKKDVEAYYKKVQDIERSNADKLKDIEVDYERAKRDALKNYTRQLAEIRDSARKRDLDIESDYKKKLIEVEADYQEKITQLKKDAATKQAEIIANGIERQRELTQQSIDRLRSGFASSVALSLADAFKDTRTSTGLLDNLKKRFAEAEALAKGAASLAAKGYSQTFIEEVIKAGPQQGMEMITQLLAASPEQQTEIQTAYANLETITNSGLNTLAETMNKGGNLATEELRNAYKQVLVDVQASLAETNAALQTALADQLVEFEKAKTEAQKARDERLAESAKQLAEALADADKKYMETLEDLKTKYNDALADAQVALQRSLRDAQADYEKAIDAIAKSTDAKLASLKAKLQEIAALMAQLATLGTGTKGTTATVSPYTGGGSIDRLQYTGGGTIQNVNNYNNSIYTTNLTSPQETSAIMVSMIKYGQVVQIANSGQVDKSAMDEMMV